MEKTLLLLLHHIPKAFRFRSLTTTSQNMGTTAKIHKKMSDKTYEDAISVLNGLQSNVEARAAVAANRLSGITMNILPHTLAAVTKIGISSTMLNQLNIIHVAGTKGKGTTCAFTESILRHAGLRTGFYLSPHLVAVRERIKIDGKPISPEKFAQYFFETYENLKSPKDDEDFQMPQYFQFLTCMAFHVFFKEKVDVAVIEVGIGGRFDSTNIISKPIVVGITSLGLEHQALIGHTLEEIALNKAGIMKEAVPAFTVHNHPPKITELLREHASFVKCPFDVAPPLETYPMKIDLSIDDGNVTRLNAALAIQLANTFLKTKYPHKLQRSQGPGISKEIQPFHIEGLQSTNWPGRFQIIEESPHLSYFLDGAHTLDSVSIAIKWFRKSCNNKRLRILVFHLTGERVAPDFLKLFANSEMFDLAIFCPLVIRSNQSKNDNWSALLEGQDVVKACQENCNVWENFVGRPNGLVLESVDGTVEFIRLLYEKKTEIPPKLDAVFKNYNGIQDYMPMDVFITGSLHLVGNFLSILTPELRSN